MFMWKADHGSAACRFGIAGDFLPAAGLVPTRAESWAERAELIRPLFQDLEFGVVNLECPLNVRGIAAKVKASLGDTFAAETEALAYLSVLRANVVGLANNHLYDYGLNGAVKTLTTVKNEFSPCGFGRSLEELADVHIRVTTTGARVGIWAAGRNLPDSASRSTAGIEPATRERAEQALAQMDESGARCRVAFLHAGAEGTNCPDPEDVQFIDQLAAMGFDVVAACHSHRISGYKTARGKNGGVVHCFYGLGSLSSGVLYSPLEHEGILAVIALDANGNICEVEARPIYLDAHGWGRIPSPEESRVVAARFAEVSAAIEDGSYQQAFYRDVSRDLMGTQWRDIQVAFARAGLRGLVRKLGRMRPAHIRRLYHKSLDSIGLG
jgi:poly-gamma-glutamate synthesis protein (capsule biosynthesis protein)